MANRDPNLPQCGPLASTVPFRIAYPANSCLTAFVNEINRPESDTRLSVLFRKADLKESFLVDQSLVKSSRYRGDRIASVDSQRTPTVETARMIVEFFS